MEIWRGVLRARFARVCVVQDGQRVTVLHALGVEQQYAHYLVTPVTQKK